MGYIQMILLLVLSLSVVTPDLVKDAADTVQEKVDGVKDLVSYEGEDPGSEVDNLGKQVKVPKAGAQSNEDNTMVSANGYVTRCQICTETREDNGQVHIRDDNQLKPVSICQEHECEPRYDWCLETYYEHRQTRNSAYDEIRVYTCGNKALRDGQSLCMDIEQKANVIDAMKVQKCRVMRSSSTVAVSYSSLVVSLTILMVSKLLLLN